MSRNISRSSLHWGVIIFWMSRTFAGPGLMPSFVYVFPRKQIDSCFIKHLSLLNRRPFSAARFIKLIRFASWTLHFFMDTHMSSAILTTPSRPSRISSILALKISCEVPIPNEAVASGTNHTVFGRLSLAVILHQDVSPSSLLLLLAC